MDEDLHLITRIDENRSLCISSIPRKTFEECGAKFFNSDRGFFVYEQDDRLNGGISILAKVASLDAAYRLVELVGVTRSVASIRHTLARQDGRTGTEQGHVDAI